MPTKEPRVYAVCSVCGEKWNVSCEAKIPKDGYKCPHCTTSDRRKARAALKWALLTLAGVALYLWGAEAAYIERGSRAYGGECLLLLLPLWYRLAAEAVKDVKNEFIKGRKMLNVRH